MATFTLIVSIPQLHPPLCTPQQSHLNQCVGPTSTQLGFLILGLGFLTVGTGGVRPCSLPFGLDQFDATTEEGRKGINSFFNWYYVTFTMVLIIALTVVVYIQDTISWVIGFAIPTGLMAFAIVLFFLGSKMYIYVKPEGSIFTGIAQGFVVAYKKRKLRLPAASDSELCGTAACGVFYDPPLMTKTSVLNKLPLTNYCR